jgi:periodic tryptophan protein 1
MITTTAWVRRGVAAQFPVKYEIDEQEMNRISKLARMQLEEAQDDLNAAKDGKMDDGEDAAMDEDKKEADAMQDDSEKKASKDGNESKSTT